jgi:hypothetical protein
VVIIMTSSSIPSNDVHKLQAELERVRFANVLLRDEVAALKAESRAYQAELAAQTPAQARANTQDRVQIAALEAEAQRHQSRVRALEAEANKHRKQLQEAAPFVAVGREVRLRYLEVHYQRRMGRQTGTDGDQRIKAGDRAAHRGRPVADAALCANAGSIGGGELGHLKEVYNDLYGITPEEMARMVGVSEVVAAVGFHASLQSEGRKTDEFQRWFKKLMGMVRQVKVRQLGQAFKKDMALIQAHDGLQDCYDKIVAAERLGRSPRPHY